MKWIKASEQLPGKVGDYYVKWNTGSDIVNKSIIHGTPDGFFANEAAKYTHEGGRPIDMDEIDSWLDESNEGEERKFSLEEALGIWDAGYVKASHDHPTIFDKEEIQPPSLKQYFKDKFNIDI